MVAVISYTGYDMEDAMILNQGAYNRGFGHASVYKTQVRAGGRGCFAALAALHRRVAMVKRRAGDTNVLSLPTARVRSRSPLRR